MELIPITLSNLDLACEIATRVFPNDAEDIRNVYLNSLLPRNKRQKDLCNGLLHYFIAGLGIGITGLYTKDDNDKTAWLGWFGVLPEYRGSGLGKKLLIQTIELAKLWGFDSLSLWTTDNDPETMVANKMYLNMGFDVEMTGDTENGYPVLIYSIDIRDCVGYGAPEIETLPHFEGVLE